MEYFARELKEEWALMRQKNFTLDKLMEYVYGEQISKIPSKHYNEDAQVKYLDFGSLYTYCCHGNKEHLIKRWLRERIAYVDSMMEYFTSIEEQVIIRMNKTGQVSFDITSYIPLYFSVKWSNATGGTQTIRVERGKSYTFNYISTTSTDQEVIVYHSKQIKRLDNLSNLRPSSCLLANANKLTEVEIHSDLLYNINVTENKFLKRLDLEGCSTLGTVVATGSTLDLSNCRYLNYVNTYGTALTSITLDSRGGSLREIYYPKTLQSLVMIKQPLLEVLGLPYGNGDEIPTALYNVEIRDCPSIKKLNSSINNYISSTMVSMTHTDNLFLRNSLDFEELRFDGFKNIKNVTIENMYSLQRVGFNDLIEVGNQPTLGYIGLSNCPLLTDIALNCSNNLYEITFIDGAIIDFGRLPTLRTISSNCVIKGVKTIVVPKALQDIDFKTQYGTGTSTIENIWVSDVCSVNNNGTTITVTHILGSDFKGIDFKDMSIRTIDMSGFDRIENAINFNISPTTTNPNMNTSRDGTVDKPWFRPSGTLNLTEYRSNWNGLFKGLDLDKVNIIMPSGNIVDTNISNMFEGVTFRNEMIVNSILAKFTNASNLNYIFKKVEVSSANRIAFPRGRFTLKGGFYQSKLASDIDLPLNVSDVSDCFRECENLKFVTSNWNKKFTYAINSDKCYYDCLNILTIDGEEGGLGAIPYAWGGHGFTNETKGEYIIEVLEDNTEVFFGQLIADGTVEWGDGTYTHGANSHVYEKTGIYTIKGKVMTNENGQEPNNTIKNSLISVNNIPSSIRVMDNAFANCKLLRFANLENSETGDVISAKRMFFNNIELVSSPELDFSSMEDITEMFYGCAKILGIKFKNLIGDSIICDRVFDGCERLETIDFAGAMKKETARKILDTMNEFVSQETVRDVSESVHKISFDQERQDEEILVNMNASVDIFEMVLDLIYADESLAINTKDNKKGGRRMVELYVTLIIKGEKTISQVPKMIRPQVEAMLDSLGVEYK